MTYKKVYIGMFLCLLPPLERLKVKELQNFF